MLVSFCCFGCAAPIFLSRDVVEMSYLKPCELGPDLETACWSGSAVICPDISLHIIRVEALSTKMSLDKRAWP